MTLVLPSRTSFRDFPLQVVDGERIFSHLAKTKLALTVHNNALVK